MDSPWLIGGSGRSGKTTLVSAINKGDGCIAGFPVEGLFTAYLRRFFVYFPKHLEKLMEEYLNRPRYMDIDREAVQRPIELFKKDIIELRQAVPHTLRHQICLIHWLLKLYAEDHGKNTWAAFDLHPEFSFLIFRKYIPGLRLAIMLRDPREVLCSMLYWRHYPERSPQATQRFKHGLLMWCLSIQTALKLKNRYPDSIELFSFNALVKGEKNECEQVSKVFSLNVENIYSEFNFTPLFSYQSDRGFFTPKGSWQQLLSQDELREVEQFCWPSAGIFSRYFNVQSQAENKIKKTNVQTFLRFILILGYLSPRLTRMLIDFICYPRVFFRRRVNYFRITLKENIFGT